MNIIRYKTPALAAWSSFDRWNTLRELLESSFPTASSVGWAPPLDVYEDDEKITVILEVAGAKKESFDLSLKDGALTISGERTSPGSAREGESFRGERVFGTFRRTVSLPAPVNSEAVTATYQDGVLTVVLPKADEAKPRKIAVNLN